MGGTWGLVVLTPLYFLFDEIGRQFPPATKHPDFYYGFLGLGNLVGAVGIEPTTFGLKGRCSTTELRP